MNKKGALIITGIVILAVGLIGGAMAASAPDGKTKGTMTTKGIGIQIKHEIPESEKEAQEKAGVSFAYDTEGNVSGLICKTLPGAKIVDQVSVKNTKDKSVYIRLTINKAWSDTNGNKNFDFKASDIRVENNGAALATNSDWIVQSFDDDETLYCYYTKPLEGGMTSANVFDLITIFAENSSEVGNEVSGYQADISFEADAIQKAAAEDAMLAEWGVVVDMDGAGNITSITDQ